MGGKVLVPMREHADRLNAARLQCDVMGSSTLIIARTDAEAATFLTSTIDSRDHPFILGATKQLESTFDEHVANEKAQGRCGDAAGAAWIESAQLKTFPELVREALPEQDKLNWDLVIRNKNLSQMKAEASKILGFEPYFDWEAPRAREGYYRVAPSTEYATERAKAFAPHSDLLWMETATPDVDQARDFARNVRQDFPHQMLAYNLSPSFNWDAPGVFNNDEEIEAFTDDLAKCGYVWQFTTLAGFHTNGLATEKYVRRFADVGMKAYVEDVQREEKAIGASILKHQTWSGAELMDRMQAVATGGGASTASMGAGVTEDQFEVLPPSDFVVSQKPLSRFEHRLMLEARAAAKAVEPRTGAAL